MISLNSRTILGLNQEAYQKLRLTLSLNLRRQILMAICDDYTLQRRLAAQLETDLPSLPAADNSVELVSIQLSPRSPDLPRQIWMWLKAQRAASSQTSLPHLQILGIEQLTRQPASAQQQFLATLRHLERLLPHLESTVIIWLTRPWARKIQQSVPRVWQCRSGLFEFVAEPIPLATPQALGGEPSKPHAAAKPTANPDEADVWTMLTEDLAQLDAESSAAASTLGLQIPEAAPSSSLPAADILTDAPLQGLEQIEQHFLVQDASPQQAARTYLHLGQGWRDRIEAGEGSAVLLTAAMMAYERALPGLSSELSEWADALNDLGSLYWLQAQQTVSPTDQLSWLHRSVETYEQVLGTQDFPGASDTLLRVNQNLGAVYCLLANYQDPASNLYRAIQAYHRALQQRPMEAAPADYGALQNTLGAVYWRLAQHQAAPDNLHQAITAYTEALKHQSPRTAPLDYAMVQTNLGIAYWSLAQYERPVVLLEYAIDAYRSALAFRTPTTDLIGYAATQNNLGTTYWDLARYQKHLSEAQIDLWQRSLEAYEQAITAAQQLQQQGGPALNFDLWATYHSAGVVHDQLALYGPQTAGSCQGHLQQALQYFLMALAGWQGDPDSYAMALSGIVHSVRHHYELLGIDGQQQAFSQIPAQYLPEILPRL
ncbi:hypothetical protein XM38_011480 [Halomicronema hongdechloris C2206]|uniref:Tetratricopeptide repeat protein n=1 Tax=Halomicronema hongdechloris C2206 TaxID=1641165 RepID=A0A1Z3HIU2_9CYAN|nr:tetratricopeptide repeat protein [Halomicronema hongdechloris]ASC70218.1 hypothetical protein XM38_011480 [Halomicronema hongdechloris C2206]